MKVLVINAGSSSLKYQLLNMETEAVMVNGIVERIGEEVGSLTYKANPDTDAEKKIVKKEPIADHKVGMHMVLDLITGEEAGVISDPKEIDAIGHRVVQGGEAFTSACIVDDSVKAAIADNNPLAPLHNPANLMGIDVAEELFPGTPNVAVFDTEFHSSMPEKAFLYALPYDLYKELRIRRYGFHGTSHKYVSRKVAECMGKKPEEINVVTVHLGNGCSMAAVEKGKCVDTSMGMTPLAGVMMGTRSGDIDPAIVAYIAENKNMSVAEVDTLLNKQSGLKGICQLNDMRDIHAAVDEGNEKAKLAVDMFAYRVKKTIGAYAAVLGNVDAIVFTAGIGENDDIARAEICQNLSGLGIEMDMDKNAGRKGEPHAVHTDASKVQVWVIPTNEELQIAQEAVELLK